MGKFIGKLAGKKVVVVGGSSGIGYGAAEAFVALGADVAIVSSSPERVEAAVQRLQAVEAEVAVATKPQVQGVVADVRDEEGFTAALLALAPVDHLVFSAVDTIIRGPLAELDVAQAQHLFGVKFWGSVRVGKALAQHEIVRPGGSLTLTSGAAAYRHSRDAVVGGALNAGVINLTHSLAAELAGPAKRIRVNTVVPGLVKTPLWDKLGHSAEAQEHIFAGASAKLSVGFVAGPDDIAEAYVYAARADYANGTTAEAYMSPRNTLPSPHLVPVGGIVGRPVDKVVEASGQSGAVEIRGGHADKGAGEAAVLAVAAALVGHDGGVVDGAHGQQVVVGGRGGGGGAVPKLQTSAADGGGEADLAGGRQGHGRGQGGGEVAVGGAGLGGEDLQLALAGAVVVGGDGGVEKVVAAVVEGEAGKLALVLRLHVDDGLSVKGKVRLPPGHEGLLEPGPGRLAAEQHELPVGAAKEAGRLGRAQPLEVGVQPGRVVAVDGAVGAARVKGVALRGPVVVVVAALGTHVHVQRRHRPAVDVQPAVVGPARRLDGRLAPEHAAPPLGGGPPGQVDDKGAAVGRVHQVGVAGALQRRQRVVLGGQQVAVRVHLVGPPDAVGGGPAQRGRVVVAGAAFGHEQIVAAGPLVQMGALGQGQRRAAEDVAPGPDEPAGCGVVLLQADAGKGAARGRLLPVVPQQDGVPVAAVVGVVEERRVEAGGADKHGLRPGPRHRRGRDNVVAHVLEAAVLALHVRVHEPEAGAVVRQARRPHAAAVRVAPQVQLRPPVQRPRHQPPPRQVGRLVDLHAGVPLKRRRRNVVVCAHPHDRRVGMEAGQDGISQHVSLSLFLFHFLFFLFFLSSPLSSLLSLISLIYPITQLPVLSHVA